MTDSGVARDAIRQWRKARSRRLVVLDDDPTGSQSVHDLQVVTALDAEEIRDALSESASSAFVLTNTRGLPEPDAVSLNRLVVETALAVDRGIDIVSRSDSTLRGHVLAEITAIEEVRELATAQHYDAVLFAPAFFEAGRFTSGDTHFATIGGRPVPAGDTEFAKDATFGYASSDLRDFLVEKSHGRISRDEVLSISLDTIIEGGVAGVTEALLRATGGAFVVVNATAYEHYETVVLGLQAAIDAGKSFLYRTGPSFVRALVGLEPQPPLTSKDFPALGSAAAHGLIIVGSHVSQTSRQVEAARKAGGLIEFELDVRRILGGDGSYLPGIIDSIRASLGHDDVLVYTSREFVGGADAASSLDIARAVSTAVSTVVAGALAAKPAWVIAKGGITSHDVAVRGLGMRRAIVLGQLLPGQISVFQPIAASAAAVGVPYVVFAGNVGDDGTLAQVISVLREAQSGKEGDIA